MTVREAEAKDLPALLGLYAHLHSEAPLSPDDPRARAIWAEISADPRHHILLVEAPGEGGPPVPAASCVLLIVPNLTHGGRPYGLVENVVTHPVHRHQGYALAALQAAKELAIMKNCYKLMLLSGGKHHGAFALYERAGYNRRDKTAFVQWLP